MNGAVPAWRSSFPRYLLLAYAGLLFVLLASASHGKANPAQVPAKPKPAQRTTLAEANEILRQHPELSAGLTAPNNMKIYVTKAIWGGFAIRFEGPNGLVGTGTVIGPPKVIADENLILAIASDIVDMLKKLGSAIGGGGGGSCAGNAGSGSVQITINGDITAPINVNVCQQGSGGGQPQ